MTKLVDLSHVIENGMQSYPGLPSPQIGSILDHAKSRSRYGWKAEFYIGKVDMPCNTGTYIDSPFHRHKDKEDLSQIPLEKLAGVPGLMLNAETTARGPVLVEIGEQARGRAVLIRTGWDARWGSPKYWEPAPYLSTELLDRLIRAGAAMVGVDFWNVDNVEDPVRPAHTRLLEAGILIVENLCNLAALPQTGFRFYAVAPRIVDGASFPVRAFAELDVG